MSRSLWSLLLISYLLTPASTIAETIKEQLEWSRHFEESGATGTIVIHDERGTKRAQKRFSPASTFKIPHALFALDAGLVRDEFQIFPWDGKKRFHPPWNQDQNLRSSMRHSVVWVYEQFANELGEARERQYLEKAVYGNANPTGKKPFWINGNLRISAAEQITFLKKLHQNTLPFPIDHQRLVKDIMIVEARPDRTLRAKSGWNGKLGWWVGWVDTPNGAVFFALNVDTPNGTKDLALRESIPREILTSIGAL